MLPQQHATADARATDPWQHSESSGCLPMAEALFLTRLFMSSSLTRGKVIAFLVL